MNRPHDLVVPEFGFGLALELRFGHFDGDHRGETFPEVIARNIKFEFAGQPLFVSVGFEGTGQGLTKAGNMGSTFVGIDVVYVGMDVLGERGIVLQGDLHRYGPFGVFDINRCGQEGFPGLVQIGYKFLQTSLRIKLFLTEGSVFQGLTTVFQGQTDSLVQVR